MVRMISPVSFSIPTASTILVCSIDMVGLHPCSAAGDGPERSFPLHGHHSAFAWLLGYSKPGAACRQQGRGPFTPQVGVAAFHQILHQVTALLSARLPDAEDSLHEPTTPPVCPLRNACRFSALNGQGNSPPRDEKITVLHESTTDGLTVERPTMHLRAGRRRWLSRRRGQLLVATGRAVPECLAFLGGDRRATGPQLLRAGPPKAARPRRRVRLTPRRRGVGPGPLARVAAPRGALLGPTCQGADAGLDRPIVPWHVRRREQVFHPAAAEEFLHRRGA